MHGGFIIFAIRLTQGPVAERLGRGLQNLVQRFESARDLNEKPRNSGVFLCPLLEPSAA